MQMVYWHRVTKLDKLRRKNVMVPLWLQVLAIISLVVAFLNAFVIVFDIVTGHRQKMAIMNIVWPMTALYFGPLAIRAYWKMGRQQANREQEDNKTQGKQRKKKAFWETTFVGVTHCGAGCTLGDIIALWPELIFDYILPICLASSSSTLLLYQRVVFPSVLVSGLRSRPIHSRWLLLKLDCLAEWSLSVWSFFIRPYTPIVLYTGSWCKLGWL